MSDTGSAAVSTCSASGKVLVTGGYVILEEEAGGLVLSVSSRFHASVVTLPRQTQVQQQSLEVPVLVFTPQRTHRESVYSLHLPGDDSEAAAVGLSAVHLEEKNKFVELALKHSLTVISTLMPNDRFVSLCQPGLAIYLAGDHQFYSAEPLRESDLGQPPKTKTGLGSSAALVASLVGALFAHFKLMPMNREVYLEDPNYNLAHITAQFVHCLAQGKVGSGFDVGAAFFGSQRYQRFSPLSVNKLLAIGDNGASISRSVLLQNLRWSGGVTSQDSDDSVPWRFNTKPFVLPTGMQMMLGDVEGGSETPGMVKCVLKWRRGEMKQTAQQADVTWMALRGANDEVERDFRALADLAASDEKAYMEALDALGGVRADQWGEVQQRSSVAQALAARLASLRAAFVKVRHNLKNMGEEAKADIEPQQRSALLDELMAVPGVLIAGIPGAGGYDALFAIVMGSSARQRVLDVWASDRNITYLPIHACRYAGLNCDVSNVVPDHIDSAVQAALSRASL
jgi:phosphomevalonate kinase